MPWVVSFHEDSYGYHQPARFHAGLEEVSERTEVEVQIPVFQAELRFELVHALVELHGRPAEVLELLVGKRYALHPAERLALHQLAEKPHERQDEPREALLDFLRVGVHAPREGRLEGLQLPGDPVEGAP